MADSMEKKILAALKTALEELTFLNVVSIDKIRIANSDFQENEIPGIQIYDSGQFIEHNHQRVLKTWALTVEYFQKVDPEGRADQATLFDRKLEIERKIGDNLKLSINSTPDEGAMRYIKYVASTTDLFMISDMSILQLFLEVRFETPYTGNC